VADGNGRPSRRRLLALSAAAVAAPVLAPLAGCARRLDLARRLSLPAPVAGKVTLSRALVPELSQVGGAVIAAPDGADAFLVANTTWGYVALKAACTHARCEVSWVPEDDEAECPCHGSRFASDGSALSLPATGPLPAYTVTIDRLTKDVVVDLRAVTAPGSAPVFGPVGADGLLRVAVADHPELGVVGGSVTGYGPGLDHPVSVVRFGSNEWRAFDATCTHQGCAVDHVPAARLFACPCHGSQFDETGKNTRVPKDSGPLQPLKSLGVDPSSDPTQAVVKIR
jgi:Rieske Fe-S protein